MEKQKEVQTLAGKEYTARDKTVSKMTRDGLTEENLREGSVKEVGQRSRGHPEKSESEYISSREKEQSTEEKVENIQKSRKQLRMRRYQALRYGSNDMSKEDRGYQKDANGPDKGENFSGKEKENHHNNTGKDRKGHRYGNKLRDHELVPESEDLNSYKSSISNKQKKVRLMKEEAKAGRLSFEDESSQMIRGFGMKIGAKAASAAGTAVSSYAHEKVREEEDDNAAVESAHSGELAGERAASLLKRTQKRSQRSDMRAAREGYRTEEIQNSRLRFHAESEAKTSSRHKTKERQSFLNRFFQRKRYKDAYRAAKSGASAGKLGGAAAAGGVENMTVKAKIVMKDIIRRNHAVLVVMGIFGLLFLLIAVAFGSCSASVQGSGSVIGITTYPSSDEDIYAAENAYLELENALNSQINNMESEHPGYDEYQYNVSEITHNPYHLISYLTAKYGDWTYADVDSEIEALFSSQYSLNTEEKTETVTETRTVRVGESIGQVVTSGYCSCSICCGQWAGGPTASGAYPAANHTLAVDAYDPIVPIGTKVVMNGVEYTVEDTGAFARYGVDFDVYYDNHAAASAHGHQTWECYLADDNGRNEITVTETSTKKILYVTLSNRGLDAVGRENLNEEQLILYNALNTTLGNRNYLWDTENISGGSGGMDYEIPPEALEDEEFARMIQEAEKYLGVPYVWGGYSPSGFDCSGFVSYVVNHCGNGWNYGRLTAEGLRGQCALVSPTEAKPGDLIFFQGTYNTSGASHVGIYVGNGMMIHCGDPVQYANINSSYWKQHFLSYGRLP